MPTVLCGEHFLTEEAALGYIESKLWPNGPVCPRCGETGQIGRLVGKTTRPGLCKCYSCRKPFTVRQDSTWR
jgi:transposase-like protein